MPMQVRFVNFYPPCDPMRDPHPWRTTSWLTETAARRHAKPGALAVGVRVEFEAVPLRRRHVFEVYDAYSGAQAAFYPVDVADEASARHAAHRRAAELENGGGAYAVRELGRPLSPGASK